MPRKILSVKEITIPEARELLERSREGLGEFQRRVLDYLVKFSKLDPKTAAKLTEELISKFDLSRRDAVQLVNCMPSTIEEARAILSAKGRVILTSTLEGIIRTLQGVKGKD
ncbi:MAG: RNA polymerase Rpb4 family protein [Candidatus Bathyarchaeia archaeon]